jgi:hypothetical protein
VGGWSSITRASGKKRKISLDGHLGCSYTFDSFNV